jgi:molybdate transport system substrate-binding protein
MNTLHRFSLLLFIFFAPHVSARTPARIQITVSAAASLNRVLTEIGRVYEMEKGVRVRFNFGASGALQRQIEEGAPIDVYIAAAERNMNELARQKLIVTASRRVIARNRLALVVPHSSRLSIRRFKDLVSPSVRHIALGGPQVPAGLRAREVFTQLGVWPHIQRKAVRAKDVREALAQVERGNVDAGVVYLSDAVASRDVRIISIAPASMHTPIRYPAAVITGRHNIAAARDFVRFLASSQARTLFRRYHFLTP